MTHNPAGAAGRAIPAATIPPGDLSALHFSTLEPGKAFGPIHKNPNHEFRMIHIGKLELLVEGQPPQPAEAGDVVFAPANQMYTVRNPGDVATTYFTVLISRQSRKFSPLI